MRLRAKRYIGRAGASMPYRTIVPPRSNAATDLCATAFRWQNQARCAMTTTHYGPPSYGGTEAGLGFALRTSLAVAALALTGCARQLYT